MNVQKMKKLLRGIKPERIKISNMVRFKIKNVHNVDIQEVIKNLRNPDSLKYVEVQQSRRPHDETYGLLFEISKRKVLFIVITYKTLENKIYVVTAFPSIKKLKKIIKNPKIRR